MGLKPGGSNGSWLQPVPIRRFNIVPEQTSLEFVRDGKTEKLEFGKDYVRSGDPVSTDNMLEAAVVFVGYGITAPEFNYDDYAGLDDAYSDQPLHELPAYPPRRGA